MSKKRYRSSDESFHTILKIPLGESPYVKAKYVQLVEKDLSKAIALFWAAINGGDRVDSALKDMTLLMKQQNRAEEAIEAIKSFRHLCPDQSQESLDNVLLELYRRCGRLEDEIELLQHKIYCIKQGISFKGKRTKSARSQGRRFQISKHQEITRLLGNLGWAYMQQSNFAAAEAAYSEALSIGPDDNKVCNLGICLLKQGRLVEAKNMLVGISPPCSSDISHHRAYRRAQEILGEIEGCFKLEETTKSGLKILPEARLMHSNGYTVCNSKEGACFSTDKDSAKHVRHKLENEGYEIFNGNRFDKFVCNSKEGACFSTDTDSVRHVRRKLENEGYENEGYETFNGNGFDKFSPYRIEKDEKYGIYSPTSLDSPREIITGGDDFLYKSCDRLMNKNPYGDDKAHAIWANLNYCENALDLLRAKRVENGKQVGSYSKNLPAAVEIEGTEHRKRRLRVFEEMTANVASP